MSGYGSLLPNNSTSRLRYDRLPDVSEDHEYVEISGENFGRRLRRRPTWQQAATLSVIISAVVGVLALRQGVSSLLAANGIAAASGDSPPSVRALPPLPTALYQAARAGKARRLADLSEDAKRMAFDSYRTQHARAYASDGEAERRFAAFKLNLALIDALNDANPLALFEVNEYADMTAEERAGRRMSAAFANYQTLLGSLPAGVVEGEPRPAVGGQEAALKGGLKGGGKGISSKVKGPNISKSQFGWITEEDCAACGMYPELGNYTLANMPTEFDWRAKYETPVSSQGYCGSCWSFSTAGDIEGKWFLATGQVVELSKQQLVACDQKRNAAEGCNGGLPYAAMQYVASTGGLVYEEDYPYKNVCAWGTCGSAPKGTPTCDTDQVNESLKDSAVAHIGGWQMVALGAQYEDLLATAMVKNGPISIVLNAVGMEYYKHGITGCPEYVSGTEYCKAGAIDTTLPCEPTTLDHAVLVVGFGEQDGVEYWVVKNSWGSWWGEGGYYRVVKGQNHCGLANFAVTSVIKDP